MWSASWDSRGAWPTSTSRDPALAPQAIWVSLSAVGGFVLVFSALLLIGVLLASHRAPMTASAAA